MNTDFFAMSDDDFLAQEPQLEQAALDAAQEQADEDLLPDGGDTENTDEPVDTDTGSEEDESDAGDDETSETEQTDSSEETLENEEQDSDDIEDGDTDEASEVSKVSEAQDTDTDDTVPEALQELYKPFKANGRMMNVNSVEEARTLMQKGANYNKKMSALKPAFKVAKMLENNDLLDENTVSYLIDLQKGNPEAIKKLLADTKFDVDEFDGEKGSKYAPTTEHKVTDDELALDDVLAQVRESETYQATMNVIGKEWDESSKGKLVANPQMILKLDEHMGNGLYEKIQNEIVREQALGNLTGLSDLDAYFKVGQRMLESGQLAETTQPQQTPVDTAVADAAKKAANEKRKQQRKAAAPTKAKKPVKKDTNFNPFAISDEEFEKQFGNSIF